MPIMHAALKSRRADKKRTQRNQEAKTKLKTNLKRLEQLIKNGQVDEAKKELVKTTRLLDHTAARGIIPKPRARRKKSRLTCRIKNLQKSSK